MWFVLDNALILPEYLVEFEYTTNLKSTGGNAAASGDVKSAPLDTIEKVNDDCNKLLNAVNGA